jgi:uncharacterized membrane-anchored protein
MRTVLFWIGTLLAFGATNAMIARKESAIRTGTTMYLELGPRDPRSLMQGDYMALRYDLGLAILTENRRGAFVVRLSSSNVAQIVREYHGGTLAANEHLLRYTRGSQGVRIGTDSFFFQEGHGQYYAQARYGELRVAPSGESVLVSLRNADLSLAGPP